MEIKSVIFHNEHFRQFVQLIMNFTCDYPDNFNKRVLRDDFTCKNLLSTQSCQSGVICSIISKASQIS